MAKMKKTCQFYAVQRVMHLRKEFETKFNDGLETDSPLLS
jgi:hypothetical protein